MNFFSHKIENDYNDMGNILVHFSTDDTMML